MTTRSSAHVPPGIEQGAETRRTNENPKELSEHLGQEPRAPILAKARRRDISSFSPSDPLLPLQEK